MTDFNLDRELDVIERAASGQPSAYAKSWAARERIREEFTRLQNTAQTEFDNRVGLLASLVDGAVRLICPSCKSEILDAANPALRLRIAELEAELQATQSRAESYGELSAERGCENSELKERIAELELKRDYWQAGFIETDSKLKEKDARIAELEAESARLQRGVMVAESETSSLRSIETALQGRIAELEAELIESRQYRDIQGTAYEGRIAELEAQLLRAQQEKESR